MLLPLAEHHVDTQKLLIECGIDAQDLEHPRGQIPLSRYISFMNRASKETNDRLLGVKLSKSIGPELLGALGFLFISSRNLFEGLNAICHYQNLFQESTHMSLEKSGQCYFFRYDIYGLGSLDTRIDIELSIAYTARLIRLYSNNDVKPLKIEFRHAPSDQAKIYQQLLSVPCDFNQDINGIYIRAEDARYKGRRFDAELTRILQNYLDTDLASKNVVNLFSDQVKRAIIDTQGQEFPTAQLIANRLGVSIPTFYRRLKSEEMSFKAILDEQYFEFARHYLTDTKLNVYQIGHLLGFSTSSAFIRAFKKWSGGKSPLNYRRST
jgi:AraC-like DNA-binding protein